MHLPVHKLKHRCDAEHDSAPYVIGSEKRPLSSKKILMYFLCVGLKLQVCYLFAVCFRCMARCVTYVVMGDNARRCSQMQNEMIASKTELPVKKLNIRILT